MSVTPFPKRYTRHEAAALLGISLTMLDRELKAKRIQAYRPGRKTYYLEHHLTAFLERNSTPCVSASNQDASAIIGCQSVVTPRSGAEPGSTAIPVKHDAKVSLLKALGKPAKP